MDVLQDLFPSHLISLRPARSPNFSLCDYFLWGHLKAEVYKLRPTTIDELKAAIRQKVNEISQEITQRVMEIFRNRLHQCIAVQGRHLEDVIF